MREEFLHWLWKNGYYDAGGLCDADGVPIEVLTPGEYNRDAGPDFFSTRLRIGGTEWAGNTEIHINSSDWYRHGHHTDHAYENVILHLVINNDADTFTLSGRRLLNVTIRFDQGLWDNYVSLINNPSPLSCHGMIGTVDIPEVKQWLWKLAVDRLIRKGDEVERTVALTRNDWEETLYRRVVRYFGFRVNTGPFELLATRLPLKIIRKHADRLTQVEALLFGTAGLLEETLFREAADDYFNLLAREYRMLRSKYSLQPVEGWLWKFHRLRPANFPTVRIAQLAALLCHSQGLFSRVLEGYDRHSLGVILGAEASPYWRSHYQFGRVVPAVTGRAGRQAVDLLIINAIVPLLFAYGRVRQQQEWCDRAVALLDSLPPETNGVVNDFVRAGLRPGSALASQALLELRNQMCRKQRCLHCPIGSSIIASEKTIGRSDSLFLEP